MNFRSGIFRFCVVTLAALLLATVALGDTAEARRRKKAPVWVVFFSSTECPRCANVKVFLNRLRKRGLIKLKTFDIEKPKDYLVFSRMEDIHSTSGFSVPLVMIGEKIFVGDVEITRKLERAVRKLAKSGGASLPYLGPPNLKAERLGPTRKTAGCSHCKDRPPTVGEEWDKVRRWVDSFFPPTTQ